MAIHRVISIETGPVNTRICKVDYGKANGKIRKAVEFATPEGAVEDGYIRDRDSYLHVLKRELKEGKFGRGHLMFTINSTRVLSREVTLPLVSYRMLPDMIESGKDEYFPVDVSNHELAYTVLEIDKVSKTRRLMLYAVPKKLVEQYRELAEKLKCKLVALDFAGNSVCQWIRRCGGEYFSSSLSVLLQMNDQNTLVTIVENGKTALQRNINFGTRNVLDAVLELYKESELSYADAYKKVDELQLICDSFDAKESAKPNGMGEYEWKTLKENRGQVTEVLRPLLLNITRMIEFYATKNKTAQVERIDVIGSGLRLKGLVALMNNEIGLPVMALENVLEKHRKKKLELTESSDFVSCFGAALSPIYYIGVKFNDGESYVAIMVCLLLLTGLIAYYGNIYLDEVKAKSQRAATIRDQYAAERDSLLWANEEKAKYELFLTDQTQVITMHESTFTHNENLKEVICLLEEMLPSNTIIHSMSSSGSLLTLSVTVATKEEAEKLLLQMRRFPYFSEVSISGISETEPEPGRTSVSFSLSCTYTIPQEEQDEENQK